MMEVPAVPSSPVVPLTTAAVYVSLVWFFSPSPREARKADGGSGGVSSTLALAHNLGISLVSAAVVLLAAADVHAASARYAGDAHSAPGGTAPAEALARLLCDERAYTLTTAAGAAAARTYHWLKYWELADTAILILKGRRPMLLHVYHHAVMLPLT